MPSRSEYVTYLLEQLEMFGDVRAKSMFGGYGLYHDDLMFALVADDQVYFKVDQQSEPEFQAQGLEPFRYEKNGKSSQMSYYQPPDGAVDNRHEICDWARKGLAAAQRSRKKKKATRKKASRLTKEARDD